MPLRKRTSDGVVVVEMSGRLDAVTAAEARAAMTSALDGPGNGLVVDLDALSFIDSSGLGALVAVHRHAVVQGKGFVLSRPTNQANLVLKVTRLRTVLNVDCDLNSAIGKAKSPAKPI